MEFCVGPADWTENHVLLQLVLLNIFSIVQCNPSKPFCSTKDFFLIILAKNRRLLSKFNEFVQEVTHLCIKISGVQSISSV